MRWYTLVPLTVLLATSVAGHPGQAEDHVQHMQINQGTLEAGANATYHVNFMAQPLEAGWILIVEGRVTAPADITLSVGGREVETWHWTPGDVRANTTILPETAEYEITLFNPGNASLDYKFTYDQTCECSAKFISMNGGAVFFNWQLAPGERSTIEYNLTYLDPAFNIVDEIEGLQIEATVARHVGPGGQWPADFELLQSTTEHGPFTMTIDPEEEDRYIVHMRATYEALDGHSVLVLPYMDTTPLDEKESPGVLFPALLAAVVLAAFVRRS